MTQLLGKLRPFWIVIPVDHNEMPRHARETRLYGVGEELEEFIDSIYEAGALPERWADLLDRLAASFGAKGGMLFHSTSNSAHGISSPSIAHIVKEFDEGGWSGGNSRVSRLLARPDHGGFLTDADLHSEEELRSLPLFVGFLNPRGAGAGAATLIQGVRADRLILTMEGFANHKAASEAVPSLNRLRPHLARATILSSQLKFERIRGAMLAFHSIGVAAAMLDRAGRAIDVNPRFEALLGKALWDSESRIKLAEDAADERLAVALQDMARLGHGGSIGFRHGRDRQPAVLHLIPLRGQALDIFTGAGAIALVWLAGESNLPAIEVLQGLFDLTPAEARVARAVGEGLRPDRIATNNGVTVDTVRSQIRSIFEKTFTTRQSELAALIGQLRVHSIPEP